MVDETSPAAPTAGAQAVPLAGDQAGATTQQPIKIALPASAEPTSVAAVETDVRKDGENELHRLVSNGLHVFGKAEHWTVEEIEKFASWLKARI